MRYDYSAWIDRFDQITEKRLAYLRKEQEAFRMKPKISLLLPTYNTPKKYMVKCIESVCEQVYENWELCIADDASSNRGLRSLLKNYAQYDDRIKIVLRKENGHISAATNSALSLATGEWVGLLDHDDELRPHALHLFVEYLNKYPQGKFFYSDEDKIDEKGKRFNPYFKPGWSPELLLGQNYLCHFCVFQRSSVERIGGFRKGLEGVQDWDLFLRLTEGIAQDNVIHIPEILYHWRAIRGSTATSTGAKSYVRSAAQRMLEDYLSRNNLQGEILPVKGGHWRVKLADPENEPRVCVIIPTKDQYEMLKSCLDSIWQKTKYRNYCILIIDNHSTEPESIAYLQSLPKEKARVVSFSEPFNYSRINNFGVRQTEAEFILLLNNDVEVIDPDWIGEMVRQGLRDGVGCVGAKLYYPDQTIQHAGVVTGIGGVAGHWQKHMKEENYGYFNPINLVRAYSAVTAACLLVRKKIFDEVGGLEEEFLKVAFNDVDFCLKVKEAGYRNIFTPFARLYHYESKSRGKDETPEKKERAHAEMRFMKFKWGRDLMEDGLHNPNISLLKEQFSLAHPPHHHIHEALFFPDPIKARIQAEEKEISDQLPSSTVMGKNSGKSPCEIIIAGYEKGGTTLVSDILRANGYESGFECGVLLAPSPREFGDIKPYSDTFLAYWGLPSEDRDEFLAKDFYHFYKDLSQKAFPGFSGRGFFDKTPAYMKCLGDVLRRAEFVRKAVVVYRDPRAVFVSWANSQLTGSDGKDIEDFIENKLSIMVSHYLIYFAGCISHRNNPNVMFLPFEGLCLRPHFWLRKLGFFLTGEPFEEKVLRSRYPNVYGSSIRTDPVFAYREVLSRKMCDRILRQTALASPFFSTDNNIDHYAPTWLDIYDRVKSCLQKYDLPEYNCRVKQYCFDPLEYLLKNQSLLDKDTNPASVFWQEKKGDSVS
ncbi:MAG: glycosyltransferase [Opitutales bacterium]|nr:glycosyltransferase [Opitutales bacterium]